VSNIAFHCSMAFVDFRHVVLYMATHSAAGGRKVLDQ
jgi:hypothetical protein